MGVGNRLTFDFLLWQRINPNTAFSTLRWFANSRRPDGSELIATNVCAHSCCTNNFVRLPFAVLFMTTSAHTPHT